MSDEGFREFHLSGKQLVFLFMTATVIAVGIFLCGVMVGRGVPVPRTEVTVISEGEGGDPTIVTAAPDVTPVPAAGDPTRPDVIDYGGLLDNTEEPPVEQIRSTPSEARVETSVARPDPPAVARLPRTPAAKVPAVTPGPSTRPAAKPATAQAPLPPPPAGNGFVVQVAAVKARAEAETILRRLSGKGYPAFITTANAGGSTMFRVRVGKYNDRQAAESIKAKLEREERFKPWVTK